MQNFIVHSNESVCRKIGHLGLNQGNNYLLILFNFYRNPIFAEPITNYTKHSIKNAYANILKILTNRGLKPQLHILENEASDIFTKSITEQQIDY